MPTIVKSNNHCEDILQKLWSQCQNEQKCDVIICAGTERVKIPAHRNVLSVGSEYFEKMFEPTWRENNLKELEIPNVNGSALQSIIEYIYTGFMKLTEENVVELLKTADMLLLSKAVTACESFLVENLNATNCIGFALLAELCRCQELFEEANAYFMNNFMDVCEYDEFLNLNVEHLSKILASDNLWVLSEEIVFNNLIKWINHDPKEREKFKAELLKFVRLPLLERNFLIDAVKPECESMECIRIYMEALELKLLPECKIDKRRNSNYLMTLTQNDANDKMHIQYYCEQQFKWRKFLLPITFRKGYGTAVMKENLFILGGRDSHNNELNSVVCLNLKTMTFSKISPMKEKRFGGRAAVLKGFLYAVGGENSNSMEKWNSETNEWSFVAPMSNVRWSFGITIFNEKLYVVGGIYNKTAIALCSAEYYDPERNEWKSIKPMNKRRQCPGIAVANGMLYAVGGICEKTVERYDPQTNNWTMICSLGEQLHGILSCTSFRNKVIVCYRDRIEEYNSERNEWKATKTFNIVDTIFPLFSYTGRLLTSEFTD